MRQTLLFFLFAITVFQLEAQHQQGNSLWHEQTLHELTPGTLEKNGISVNKFKLFQLNEQQLLQPLEKLSVAARNTSTKTVLPFPTTAGYLQRFSIKPSNTLHPDLAQKFPAIQTFEGVGLDDPTATIRFEMTPKGFSGMIWSAKNGTQVIQVLEEGPQNNQYIVFDKQSASSHKNNFTCHTDHIDQTEIIERTVSRARSSDGFLRTYRLALAVTAEYTTLYGGTKAGAMAAMVTTINRVNGILKRDVALELQLVANNDQIIFTNAETDGYTNDDSGKMLEENQTNIDNIIGTDNYDIGHVFSTGNGGVAYLGSVCFSDIKAGGVTGSQLPQGDAFDVDYVTHEIGHQLGANHTQNNDCSSTFATSVEPGSGSTIMGYAGICFPNVQNNSDDYFHAISINQIRGFIAGSADACAIKTAISNAAPTVNAGGDYTIPHSTPFELEGIATDANNDGLTYAWEQMDNAPAPMPPLTTSDKGPAFRSLPPTNSPIRQFPTKGAAKDHQPSTWEVLPSVGRTMKFRLTVRDNFSGGGNVTHDEMDLTVASNAGPFKLSSPNGGEVLAAGILQTVRWEVGGSDQAPVNCSTVDIFLSVDGGETYPIVLAENVANDGSTEVTFQNSMVTTNARIKIKGHDNVFFDVSDNNFQITPSESGFSIVLSTTNLTVCQGTVAEIDIDVVGLQGFTGLVNLTTELPSVFNDATLEADNVNTGNSTSLTINTTNAIANTDYTVTINGVNGDLTFSKTVIISIAPQIPASVSLITPSDEAQETPTMPSFGWSAVSSSSTKYTFELATTANFETLIYSEANLTSSDYTLPLNLENGQTYYWRVKTTNQCGVNENATIRSFTVTNNLCQEYTNNQELIISDGLPSTVVSEIIIQESGLVNEVKVSMDIAHSWIGDLTLTLESPSGKKAIILREICGNEDQINLIFSNNGSGTIPCSPPVSQNIFAPTESFDIFTGEEINGTWKLLVADGVELDGGSLKSWSLEVCRKVENNEPLNVLISNISNPDCNGANTGSIQASVVGGVPNYTILWSTGANQLSLNNLTAGEYKVTVTDGNGTEATAIATLNQPTPIVLEDLVQNVTCSGENNGSIQVFPSGGIPNYQYQWVNGVRQSSNLNLPDGSYRVTVTDGNGCTTSKDYTVIEPAPIELSFSSVNALNGQNGSVDLAVSGGTGEYDYEWSSGATTRDVGGLAPGNFTVTVTDANNCETTGEVTVITEITGQECYSVTINITLDNYGTENRWEIKDGNGEVVQAVGPFNNFENGSVQATTLCLPPGCYDFTIFDLWGDGMCCAYGQGGYEVIEDATGEVIASGGSFNKQESKTICLPLQPSSLSVINYCGANGRNTQYEWIQTVEIAGQVFNSGNNEGYGDFSETIIDAQIGSTLDLAFTPGFGFFEYHENWQVWVDFNKDGDFDDEGEAVFLTSGNDRQEGTIGIPLDAATGNVRLRIAMKWGELVGPCESFSWGEVEDYTLNLQGGTTLGERIEATTFTTENPAIYTTQARGENFDLQLFPNPTTNYLSLEWEDFKENTYDLAVYNSLGQLQFTQQLSTQNGANKARIEVSSFSEGLYLLHLRNKDRLITKEFVVIK